MNRFTALAVAALLATACGKGGKGKDEATGPGPAPGGGPSDGTPARGPVRLAFGDCAAGEARFESGPSSQPEASGWGTIGTGRYGTIGYGSGTGTGYGIGSGRGGMRGRSVSELEVHIGNATVEGDLDKNTIRRYIRRSLNQIRYCYEKQQLTKSGLEGTVSATFTIDATGLVVDSKATGVDPVVSSCIAGAIAKIQFPKPQSGQVKVTNPFNFRPPALEPAESEEPPPEHDPKSAPAAPHVPGDDSPLRPHAGAIEACLRNASQARGALVVELGVDAAGAVTAGRTLGVDPTTASCVSNAVRTATWAGASAGAHRCPLAFGTLSADSLPAIDITADAVMLGKDALAQVPALVADTSPEWRIAPLSDRLDAERSRIGGGTDVIAITGPHIVRPIDATPMKVVNRVMMTARATGTAVLLASRQRGAWKTLRGVALPAAPVAVGTGSAWRDWGGTRRNPDAPSDEVQVMASVLISPDGLWVGLSRVNDLYQIKKQGADHDWDALAKLLAEKKQSPFFVDRDDIEIAGEDAVTYAETVKVIEAAAAAGFTDWELMSPNSLSVKFKM